MPRSIFLVLSCALLLFGMSGSPLLAETAQEEHYREALGAIAQGRYQVAEQALQQIISTELPHPGAYLDLAVLYCSMGKHEAAESLLETVEKRFSPPQVILDVIKGLRASGCQPPGQRSTTTVRLGRGHESNANQGSTNSTLPIDTNFGQLTLILLPEFLAQGDSFSMLSLEHQRQISPKGTSLQVSYQDRSYDHLSRYNTQELQIALEQPWHATRWSGRSGAAHGIFFLNNAAYLKQSTFQAELSPRTLLPNPFSVTFAGGAFFLRYPEAPGFDARILEIRATLAQRTETRLLQAVFASQSDSAEGARPGGNRNGRLFSLQGRAVLHERLIGEARLDHQIWLGQQAYQPGFLDLNRKQAMTTLRLGLAFKLNAENSLTAEWRSIWNRENIPVFAYTNQIFQIGWQNHFSGF